MAFASKIITCLLVLKVYMAAPAESHITCGIVTSTLAQCMGYLTNFFPVPSDYCCAEVKGLNQMAQTTPDRRQVCKCLKAVAKENKGFISIELVGTLPTICGVSVPYPFNFSTNCDTYVYNTCYCFFLYYIRFPCFFLEYGKTFKSFLSKKVS
ncbi:hypothetical protein YC2023_110266 [Brassica napus]|uniref:Non-specific lipid-transfer protein n=2 Tax=Brassica TaxID=3705 RepID=A0A816PDR1_BRANA|nr:unnamed protein product [Brassica napus]